MYFFVFAGKNVVNRLVHGVFINDNIPYIVTSCILLASVFFTLKKLVDVGSNYQNQHI